MYVELLRWLEECLGHGNKSSSTATELSVVSFFVNWRGGSSDFESNAAVLLYQVSRQGGISPKIVGTGTPL